MRALLLIIDGLGVGDAPDAGRFHPAGANTLGNLLALKPRLSLPILSGMGLMSVLDGQVYDPPTRSATACYGRMRPKAAGNDSTSGHWELAGAIPSEPFAVYERFPSELVEAIEAEAGVRFLANLRLPAVEAIRRYGSECRETGQPILFTSASSALQIAGDVETIPPARLYEIARVARHHADELRIARVIARPFSNPEGRWQEVPGRADFTLPPPRTILNAVAEAGLPVTAVGKVGDLFGQSGITRSFTTASDLEGMKRIQRLWDDPQDGLIVANLSDCDRIYGHQRDPEGFAKALEAFDRWLGNLRRDADEDDLIIITSDHGNDPTFPGTDHSREEVPVLVSYDGRVGPLGVRESLSDVAATLANFFQPPMDEKESFPGEPLLTFHRPPSGFGPV